MKIRSSVSLEGLVVDIRLRLTVLIEICARKNMNQNESLHQER